MITGQVSGAGGRGGFSELVSGKGEGVWMYT